MMQTTAVPQREVFLDIAKGIAIWCIVLLHYEDGLFPAMVNGMIGMFMISLFYVSSGWLMASSDKEYTLRTFVAKRWKQLGVPYLWWTGIILGFDLLMVAVEHYDLHYIGQEVYKAVTLRGIGTLWFLPALFLGEVFWRFAWRRCRWWGQVLILVAFLVYYHCYSHISAMHTDTLARVIDAPFRTLSNAINASIYIAAGDLFRRYAWAWISQWTRWQIGMCAVFAYGMANALMAYVFPHIPLLNYASLQFLGSVSPLCVLLLVYSLQDFVFLRPLAYWGRHSLNLMVTHYSIIYVLFIYVVTEIYHIPFSEWWALGCFFTSIPLQHALVPLIDRYLPQSLGK